MTQTVDKLKKMEDVNGADNLGTDTADKSQKMQTEQTMLKQETSHKGRRQSKSQKIQTEQATKDADRASHKKCRQSKSWKTQIERTRDRQQKSHRRQKMQMEQAMKDIDGANEIQITDKLQKTEDADKEDNPDIGIDKSQRTKDVDEADNPGISRADKSQKRQMEQTRHRPKRSYRECRQSKLRKT